MSLATRLSRVLLATLAIALAGFSGMMYGLARSYLYRQLDGRLETALDTLEAALDVEPGGMEWEPDERRITLGVDPGVEQVRWVIEDGSGRVVDRAANARAGDFPSRGESALELPAAGDGTAFGDKPTWRLAGRHLRLMDLLKSGRGHPEDDSPGEDVEYAELVLIAGLSPAPVRAALTQLALALAGTSALLWLSCAVAGRQLARRALAPVSRMARAARGLDANAPGWSLAAPGTGDELDGLAAAFNELLARLREAFERQHRFAGDASHQLRTPLAGLIAQVDLALRRDRPPEE